MGFTNVRLEFSYEFWYPSVQEQVRMEEKNDSLWTSTFRLRNTRPLTVENVEFKKIDYETLIEQANLFGSSLAKLLKEQEKISDETYDEFQFAMKKINDMQSQISKKTSYEFNYAVSQEILYKLRRVILDLHTFAKPNEAIMESAYNLLDEQLKAKIRIAPNENSKEAYQAVAPRMQKQFSDTLYKLVESNQEKPHTFSKEWDAYFLKTAMKVLSDYHSNSFFRGHWNLHHVEDVKQIIKHIEHGSIRDAKSLITELRGIKLENKDGTLQRRINFLEHIYLDSLENDMLKDPDNYRYKHNGR